LINILEFCYDSRQQKEKIDNKKKKKQQPHGSAKSGVNFINILRTNVSYECRFHSFFYVHVTREKLPKQRLYKKFVQKMLMKLTTGGAKFLFYENVFQFKNCFKEIHKS